MPMASVQYVTSNVAGQVKRPRPGSRGDIRPGKSFNHFPRIIEAFPNELSAIVAETTDDLAILATLKAPVQQNPRRTDPAPGTLKASTTVKVYHARATDIVVTGRVSFPAKDKYGHRFAKPLETGSLRKTKRGLRRVAARPFLVDSLVVMRPVFIERLHGLEARLPR
jgi:hypothetical protein